MKHTMCKKKKRVNCRKELKKRQICEHRCIYAYNRACVQDLRKDILTQAIAQELISPGKEKFEMIKQKGSKPGKPIPFLTGHKIYACKLTVLRMNIFSSFNF